MWAAARQREPCCELRRACCERRGREQRGEQRRDECYCCGQRRAWHERQLCESERWSERLRCQRVEERQRLALPQLQRAGRRGCGGGVVWSAAGQLERSCELRRAERERCWREQQQRGEQRGCERDCCRAGRDGRDGVERRCWCGAQRVPGQRVGEQQRCCVQSAWRTAGGRCGHCVCGLAAGQCERACELRRAERELCCCEQCGEQRGHECDGCGAWRRGLQRGEQQGASRPDCVCRQRVVERQRACVPQRIRTVD